MKETWSALALPRKILILVNAVMVAVFFLVYLFLGNQYVCRYDDVLFTVTETDGTYLYSGELEGNDIVFSALPDNTFTYSINGKNQGIFTVKEEPSAAPKSDSLISDTILSGVEVYRDNELFFRGGFHKYTSGLLMIDEALTPISGPESFDSPSPHTVLFFALFGEGRRQGSFIFFLVALSFSALIFFTAFFSDPFFRSQMALTQDEREHTKVPTYRKVLHWIFWVALTLGALSLFIFGMMGF